MSRLDEKRNTFVAFIDFEKAFDWIDRDLLLYKILLCPTDGKIYYAIKSLYNQTYMQVLNLMGIFLTGSKRILE